MGNSKAALYLRTSKKNVGGNSIEWQRKSLRQFANERGLEVVAEYVDEATTGKDLSRDGIMDLYADMCSANRSWDSLLIVDSARLARSVCISLAFRLAAKQCGISILFSYHGAELSEGQFTILNATDQIELEKIDIKCAGGVEISVEQGYRAGGIAPSGYDLVKVKTGRRNMGLWETKSQLQPNAEAVLIKKYLEGRAAGRRMFELKKELGLAYEKSSLIDIEWNALTYAGSTVWNRHNPYIKGVGYLGGVKHRPRNEWKEQKNTHPALITENEAETILAHLFETEYSVYNGRAKDGDYLLVGLLTTPTGKNWQSDGHGFYRVSSGKGGKARSTPMRKLEGAVFKWVCADITAVGFAGEFYARLDRDERSRRGFKREFLMKALELQAEGPRNEAIKALCGEIGYYQAQQMLALVKNHATVSDRPEATLERLQREAAIDSELDTASAIQMEALLTRFATQLLTGKDRAQIKLILSSIIEKIVLDPDTLACEIHYLTGIVKKHCMEGGRRSYRPAA